MIDKVDLGLPDAEIGYYPNFLNVQKANLLFQKLMVNVPWQQDNITVFGKTYAQPRLTALYSTNGRPYSYSNISMQPHPFTNTLKALLNKVVDVSQINFTTCLLNRYRDGRDSNGWHADDERELGINPPIASISLGAERYFHLKHKTNKELKHKILLQHGSLLLMTGPTQHHWKHQIPKTAKPIGERINLTFRIID